MHRVSNVDLSFLLAETPTNHMHVMGTLILDASHMPGGYRFGHLRDLFVERLHLLPAFRRRLVEVPFGLASPVWIEDPEFDLDHHLRRAALPSPGGLRELADFVGDWAGRPLERDKPLWEARLVEGLAGGDVALVTKLHHAVMDGGTGANLLAHLFELSPTGETLEPPRHTWEPEPVPSPLVLLAGAVADQPRRPLRALGALAEAGGALVRSVPGRLQQERRAPAGPALFSAPRTSFNHALTAHRKVAFGRCDLAGVKQIAKSAGCKVNDVLLAGGTTALRAYLQRRGELPDRPLVASVPISLHSGDDGGGNQISMMLIPLPVEVPDSRQRLRAIHTATERGKREHGRGDGGVVRPFADLLNAIAIPGVLSGAMQLVSRSRLADRVPPPWNVVISNMAGPRDPIYCAGALVKAIYPMGPVVDGVGLNFTVLSNAGQLDIGTLACRELVDDVEGLTADFVAGVHELAALYDVGGAGATHPADETRETPPESAQRASGSPA